ncbi:hypothetical protein [Ferrovibrio terrae]|uniref:hypothetical protein n=1 Tax=Ferrovibrio terrae TaxID=2594003 RepID=UPI00313825D1
MKFALVIGAAVLALSMPAAFAAENPAEVAAVVAATKAANPDNAALCKSGPTGISTAVSAQVRTLAMAGKIKGNPQAVGAEAGQQIGKGCGG